MTLLETLAAAECRQRRVTRTNLDIPTDTIVQPIGRLHVAPARPAQRLAQGAACRTIGRIAAALSILCTLATVAAAQTAQIGVAAEISTTALSIAQQNDLIFGNIVPGTPTVINPRTSAGAGLFEIHGNRNAEVSVTFVLPTLLRAGTGPLTVPVSFGATSGCRVVLLEELRGFCTFFNPNVALVTRLGNAGSPFNALFVWLGGTVSPAAAQAPAVYQDTITMSVVYTGN